MLGVYNYTVILTYFGMLISFTGITCALQGNLHGALVCLMISGVCDMFDGKIASTKVRTPEEKRFGIQIDSLSDLVCFGVLPALIVHSLCVPGSLLGSLIPAAYLLATLIRLAWFNVDEEERQENTQDPRDYYLGLPVTSGALVFPILMVLHGFFDFSLHVVAPLVMLLIAVAFLTPFRLKKPHLTGQVLLALVGVATLVLLVGGRR